METSFVTKHMAMTKFLTWIVTTLMKTLGEEHYSAQIDMEEITNYGK